MSGARICGTESFETWQKALSNKHMKIPHPKKSGTPLTPILPNAKIKIDVKHNIATLGPILKSQPS